MNTTDSLFCKCDCGCGILEINTDDYNNQLTFGISLWVSHSGNRSMTKKERIRWCDHVMKTGQPWADHTIVSKKDAARIVQFLTKQIANYGKKTKIRK